MRSPKRAFLPAVLAALSAASALSETAYRLPARDIVDAVNAAPAPEAVISPARDAILLPEYEAYPPIAFVAEPILRLAGLRISPRTSSRQRVRRFTGIP